MTVGHADATGSVVDVGIGAGDVLVVVLVDVHAVLETHRMCESDAITTTHQTSHGRHRDVVVILGSVKLVYPLVHPKIAYQRTFFPRGYVALIDDPRSRLATFALGSRDDHLREYHPVPDLDGVQR